MCRPDSWPPGDDNLYITPDDISHFKLNPYFCIYEISSPGINDYATAQTLLVILSKHLFSYNYLKFLLSTSFIIVAHIFV